MQSRVLRRSCSTVFCLFKLTLVYMFGALRNVHVHAELVMSSSFLSSQDHSKLSYSRTLLPLGDLRALPRWKSTRGCFLLGAAAPGIAPPPIIPQTGSARAGRMRRRRVREGSRRRTAWHQQWRRQRRDRWRTTGEHLQIVVGTGLFESLGCFTGAATRFRL